MACVARKSWLREGGVVDIQLRDFEATMQGLEDGLRVEAISTFPLLGCSPEDDLGETLDRMRDSGLDQYPVCDDAQSVLGVVDAEKNPVGSTVQEGMIALQEDMLIAASDPISVVIPLFEETRYRLVVQHGKIAGIVTRSDLISSRSTPCFCANYTP